MSRNRPVVPAVLGTESHYFDSMYSSAVDPWEFDTSWYEQRKYDLSLALLPHRRFRRALEPGCANGALTERLADRCDELIAFDFIAEPVDRARARLAAHAHVDVRCETFPTYWPSGTGDLVVWSEVAYYLNVHGARKAIDGLFDWLQPGGTLLAVHFTGQTNYPRSGEAITVWLDSISWLERTAHLVDERFEAGTWRRAVPGQR